VFLCRYLNSERIDYMKKLMKINTSHHQFGYDEKPTGLVLGELVHFYDAFNREGYTMDIYINGSDTPIDSVSLNKLMLDRATKTYYEGAHFMALLKKCATYYSRKSKNV
ncbi:hypothetical protein O0D71_07860, partial [Staphylococcus pseudintermedius]|nr:hypothetical protein [Staphylococcus pseudintermedius]